MEPISVAASIIAIIQLADRVVTLCNYYVEALRDVPTEIKIILVEISQVSAFFGVFQNLDISSESQFLSRLDTRRPHQNPVVGCEHDLTELCKLLGENLTNEALQSSSKSRRQKLATVWEKLAWPLKRTTALETEKWDIINKLSLEVEDPSIVYNRACSLHEPQTGHWVTQCPEWNAWLQRQSLSPRCLWIYGIPGAGKTVLSSFLIRQVENSTIGLTETQVIYYYCHHSRNTDETEPFLRWVLSQSCPEALDHVQSLFVVIDGVDESENRENLARVLVHLSTSPDFNKVRLLVLSRPEVDLRYYLGPIASPVSMINEYVESDIRIYVRARFQSDRAFQRLANLNSILEEVENALVEGAQGMFRWVDCQIQTLRRCTHDIVMVRHELRNLPKGLDATYERILCRIPDESKATVRICLALLCSSSSFCALENASEFLERVRSAFAGFPTPSYANSTSRGTSLLTSGFNETLDIEALEELCSCLVTIEGNGIFLAHYTEPHLILLANMFWLGLNATPSTVIRLLAPGLGKTIFTAPFDADTGPSTTLLELAISCCKVDTLKLLLDNHVNVRANDRALFISLERYASKIARYKYPLQTWHISSFEKFELLLTHGADPNSCGMAATPLQIAVRRGDYPVAKALLAAGADPNGLGDVECDQKPLFSPLALLRQMRKDRVSSNKGNDDNDDKQFEILLESHGAREIVMSEVGE
ncbi:hypothetical protein HD806DRAFT_527622 [Xylariaceae sp. AK1471]|nr:hypothetical protein HD806DRAFT_527622 [Xylariaceae sp. AK1471]